MAFYLYRTFFLFLFCIAPFAVDAVYINRFSTTDNGGLLFTGNTLGLSKLAGQNQPGPLDSIGTFITTDQTQQVGDYLPGTTLTWQENSSYAFLDLSDNSTVLYAELVWSGSYGFQNQITGNEPNTPINLTTPQGNVFSIAPDPATSQKALTPGFSNAGNYTRSADVTSIIQSGGAGKYVVGGVAATVSGLDDTHNAAGWTLAVAYHNGMMETQNLTIFVGCEQASSNTNMPAELTGFCAPPTGALSGTLFVSAIEGDANKMGDHMLFGSTPTLTIAANSLSGVNNPINNFFASQINTLFPFPNTSAILDTRGSFGNYNANPFTGQIPYGSRQGYDITAVDISSTLVHDQMSAYALGTTTGDDYTINSLGIQIPVGAPAIEGSKLVNSVESIVSQIGDVVTFDFSFANNGTADAINVLFQDFLNTPEPSGLTYVPSSFLVSINGSPLAPPAPPNPDLTAGFPVGTVAIGNTFAIQFMATVTGYPPVGNVIFNNANINYQFQTCIPGQIITLNANTNEVSIVLPSPLVPNLETNKLVNSGVEISSQIGDIVTFEIFITNTGAGDALNVSLVDLLEPGLSLVPNSVIVDDDVISPDPNLATGLPIEDIVVGQTVHVLFQAVINSAPLNGTIFVNQGTIHYQYQPFYEVFDSLTSTTNPVTINIDPPPPEFLGTR